MRPLNISKDQAEKYYYQSDPFFNPKGPNRPSIEGYYQSRWHGKLSQAFKIEKTTILKHDFVNIISGNDLSGTQIIKDGMNSKGEKEHRAAIDIPFSAPKSVSILALHCGDEKLIQAHQKAVERTVKYIENNYVYVRYTEDKQTRPKQSYNGLFGTFLHSTSRANDPQLHSHTLLMNMSYSPFVKDYRATWNDKIFQDQKHLTMIYQSELSKLAKKLGYEIESRPNGFWEIAGVKQEWIDKFSKRTEQINEKEKDEEFKSSLTTDNESVIRNAAVLDSRDSKDYDIEFKELMELWEGQLPQKDIIKSVNKIKSIGKSKPLSSEEILRKAYSTLNENESTFRRVDVLNMALSLSMGNYLIEDLDAQFDKFLKRNEIIHLNTIENSKGLTKGYYTSSKILETEKRIVNLFLKTMYKFDSLSELKKIQAYIKSDYSYFTDDQKNVLSSLLLSNNQLSIVQGDAGTGKTTLLKALREIINKERINVDLVGLGFTGKAANELQNKAGIQSQTITKYLSQKDEKNTTNRDKIIIIDESSLVGSLQMLELIQDAIENNHRLIFVGDGKQLHSISAGNMFNKLQEYVEFVMLEQAIRQQSKHMIKTVENIKNYITDIDHDGIDKAMNIMANNNKIFVLKDRDERIKTLVHNFIDNDNYNTDLIVTPKNHDRNEINQIISNSLKERGIVEQKSYNTDVKLPATLMGEQKLHAQSYNQDSYVFINNQVTPVIGSGTLLDVTKYNSKKTEVLINHGGTELKFKIDSLIQNITAFKRDTPNIENMDVKDSIYIESMKEGIPSGTYDIVKIDQDKLVISVKNLRTKLKINVLDPDPLITVFKKCDLQNESIDNIKDYRLVSDTHIQVPYVLKSGWEAKILNINKINNTITVGDDKQQHVIDLNQSGFNVSMYDMENRDFSVGEKIIFLKNDGKLKIKNNISGVIQSIDHQGNVHVLTDDKRSIYFKFNQYQYVDKGYALTVFKSQGQDVDTVHFMSDTKYMNLNNTELLYVGITRGVNDAKLYIDNIEDFTKQIKISHEKSSTLDHLDLDKIMEKPEKKKQKGFNFHVK